MSKQTEVDDLYDSLCINEMVGGKRSHLVERLVVMDAKFSISALWNFMEMKQRCNIIDKCAYLKALPLYAIHSYMYMYVPLL